MTLKRLYSELSKIIDDNIDKNPDILDANVVFFTCHVVTRMNS